MSELMTIRTAAERLQIHQFNLRAWLSQGKLGFIRIGRSIRIREEDLEVIIQKGYVPPREAS